MLTVKPMLAVSSLQSGVRRAEPMVWLSAGAVVFALLVLIGLLSLLSVRGLMHFWPQSLLLLQSTESGPQAQLGVILDREGDSTQSSGRVLLHRGGEDFFDSPLVWIDESAVLQRSAPANALVLERTTLGPIFGFLQSVRVQGQSQGLRELPLNTQLGLLRDAIAADSGSSPSSAAPIFQLRLASGRVVDVPMQDMKAAYAPNAMGVAEKITHFVGGIGRFLGESPRRSNVQGGVFPAILGTVILVLLMAVIVSPLGVLAAIYLQEYAQRGPVTRLVRIAVNNLAGVPSIVYGVFGLGFFVYAIGGSLDSLLFEDRLPAPTLGTPGMLWAALTMALLTLPVVIVSTEEGLARVPASLREGSLALGATRAETLWHVVLPAASPAVLTGLILAVARATGEVAPLLLVGVAKYAPGLPVSGEYPYLHLDRQFMHLGFYVYDLGFQSTHLETVEGLVFATALLLVVIALLLNIAAVLLRSRLRNAFKPQEAI
ncbi:phosphate ABC transporter, permease protein PstA [gamma proteobacterium NOR5-3]|nr:phosphate ABC transporter, permease protein PstA [gamma proteobacterium NOR5-3]